MNKDSKIYVAGHRGLVGSAIIRKLEVLGYANLLVRAHDALDLINQHAVNEFLATEKPDYVFLAAAKVGGILANSLYRADFIYENLQIQNNIIHASYQNGVKKLLFLGSSCIYPKMALQPMSENALLSGELEYTNEPYAIAKIAGIKLCESFNLQYDTNYLAVMPTNLYGPNDNFDLEKSHVLPAMIRKMYLAKLLDEKNYLAIARNLSLLEVNQMQLETQLATYGIAQCNGHVVLNLWGSGTPRREFLHVDDMADACIFIMDNVEFRDLVQNRLEVRSTHINIGTGSDLSIKELAYLIKNKIKFKGQIAFDLSKPDGTMQKLQNVSKLNKLGWQHQISLDTGICQVIDWYLNTIVNA